MSRFDCGKCFGGSATIVLYLLWYVVPTIAEATLVIITKSTTWVFWILIASTAIITIAVCKLGVAVGREIPKDRFQWNAFWTFSPYDPSDIWSNTHLISSLPLWGFTNALISFIWGDVLPGWVIPYVLLCPSIMFLLSGGIGVVIMLSYREPDPPAETKPLL